MEIESTHHIDAGEKGADGRYDYYYEYDLYRFSDGATVIVARSYTDEPQETHFLRIERDGKPDLLKAEDLRQTLFVQSVHYLRGIGKQKLSWLSGRAGDYEPLLPST